VLQKRSGDNLLSITEQDFDKLSSFIKNNYGIYLKREKMNMLCGRLSGILETEGFSNFSDYCNYLMSEKSGKAAINMLNKVTTNHTYFMRESDHFVYFKNKVLPWLVKNADRGDLRIWCAACSTGEESYTLAMLVDEYLGKKKVFWDTKILATDISEKVLESAKAGQYKKESLASLPEYWRLNYFKKINSDCYEISDQIKKDVIYRKLNLMDPVFPFKKKLQVVFCRNVMIYFDEETKNELINKLYDCLEVGGYLFIGHSETINRELSDFRYVMPSVYRREQ